MSTIITYAQNHDLCSILYNELPPDYRETLLQEVFDLACDIEDAENEKISIYKEAYANLIDGLKKRISKYPFNHVMKCETIVDLYLKVDVSAWYKKHTNNCSQCLPVYQKMDSQMRDKVLENRLNYVLNEKEHKEELNQTYSVFASTNQRLNMEVYEQRRDSLDEESKKFSSKELKAANEIVEHYMELK